jgi:hypothetical protein
MSQTVKEHVDDVAKIFREHGHNDPRLDPDGNLSSELKRRYRGYTNNDPSTTHEKAIPYDVLRFITTPTPLDNPETQAFNSLIRLAFFFACRSCEYCHVDNAQDRRTQVLELRDIIFRKDNKTLAHNDPNLHLADTVTLIFRWQKRDQRDDMITQHNNHDVNFNPVHATAELVRRIRNIPGTTDNTTIDTFLNERGQRCRVTAKCLRSMLRAKLGSYGID